MKRLIQKAFIGDIKKSDLDFVLDGNDQDGTIYVELKNIDKAQHDLEDVNWGRWVATEAGQIGYLEFNSEPYPVSGGDMEVTIHVEFMEVNEAYKETQVAMYLMQYFKDNVLQPAVAEYGKNNVVLEAEVINEKLSGTLERMFGKMGVQWKDQGHHARGRDFASYLKDTLTTMGIQFEEKSGGIVVKNHNPDDVIDAAYSHGEYSPSISCGFTKEGDFLITVSVGTRLSPDAQILGGITSGTVYVYDEEIDFMMTYKDNPSNIIATIENYLNNYSFSFSYSEPIPAQQVIDELNQYAQTKTASRLKRKH